MDINLKTATTEELLQELEARNQGDAQEDAQEDDKNILHIGLIDSEGLDSIVATRTPNEFSKIIRKIQLRARFNGQRNPEVFVVKIPTMMADSLKEKEPLEAAAVLKNLSIYKTIGY